ncbi:MAG TPA: glycosyltransferase [Crocinitomicaceae bacterium]|nr:glycosyltransferase [Crocinitomicaceae bacterium]
MNISQKLSILIITFNRQEDTLELLENLSTQINYDDSVGEVLLLNNNSTVSYSKVEEYVSAHPELKINYIAHSENLGVARGRNYLIKQAKFPLLLVLDDDVVFANNDALYKASQLFDKKEFKNNVSVITLNIYYYATSERQKNALPHKKYEQYKDKDWFLTNYFVGAAHLMKKELFDKTGLYPENFFYGMEEYDLSYRIVDVGYRLAYDNSVKVLHKESPTGRITNLQKLKMMWYNKSVVAWKFLPKKYFYTTAFMWSLFFLIKSNFKLITYFKMWNEICKIPKKYPRQTINQTALDYLKSVEARLWY